MSVRRQLTILFSDLAGYTVLSEQIDPEVLDEVQTRYRNLTSEAVERFGGFVASFRGDGVVAFFGYPTAHENDAERAARAALEIAALVPTLALPSAAAKIGQLAVRIGLHTGLAVISSATLANKHIHFGAAGMAVNMAARLQGEAQSGHVVASAATISLVEGLFHTVPLGSWSLKGLSQPVEVHRIRAARAGGGHGRGRMGRGAGRLIGRRDALERLAAQQAANGCRVVEIVGEAGVGKTRLVQELCDGHRSSNVEVIEATCLEIFSSAPLYPFVGLIWTWAGLDHREDADGFRCRLNRFLLARGLDGEEWAETAFGMLRLSGPARDVTPVELRRQQFELIIALVAGAAGSGPALLWLEDVHWIDPSSAELCCLLVKRLAGMPLLLVMTRRSTDVQTVLPAADERILLAELDKHESMELAEAVPGAGTLPSTALARVVEIAEGVPLFIEQLVFSLVGQQSGTMVGFGRPGTDVKVPMSLTEMLTARLERSEGARRVAQAAACVGRAFNTPFLAAVLDLPELDTQVHVERLLALKILRPQPGEGLMHYSFSHALLHRVAHDSMLLAERRPLHARIANLLSQGNRPGPPPLEVLAYHLSEAGDAPAAAGAWIEAGTLAAQRSAHLEALEHLELGLRLLHGVDHEAERNALELRIQAGRLAPLSATYGASSPLLEACCRRGLALALAEESSPLVFVFLYGLCTVMLWGGDVSEALKLAQLFFDLGERRNYPAGQVVARRLIASALHASGQSKAAKTVAEHCLALYRPERDANMIHLFAQDTKVHCKALLGHILFYSGEVERGLDAGFQAVHEAETIRHPHSTAIAIGYQIWVLGLCDVRHVLLQQARRLIQISDLHNLWVFKHQGEVGLGWALCQAGELDQGVALLQAATSALQRAGWRSTDHACLAILADAYRRRGELSRAKETIGEASAKLTHDSLWFQPEVARVKALLAPPSEVVSRLMEAAALARRVGALMSELRCLRDLVANAARSKADGAAAPEIVTRLTDLSHLENLPGIIDALARRH